MCGACDRARAETASFDLEVAAGDGDGEAAPGRIDQGDEGTEPAQRARPCAFSVEGEDYGCRERDSESEQRRLLDRREEQYAHHDCQEEADDEEDRRHDLRTHQFPNTPFPQNSLLTPPLREGCTSHLFSKERAPRFSWHRGKLSLPLNYSKLTKQKIRRSAGVSLREAIQSASKLVTEHKPFRGEIQPKPNHPED